MLHAEETGPDTLGRKPKDAVEYSRVKILNRLAETLPAIKPGTGRQRDIIENILEITPDTGRVAPVEAIAALSKSVLWVGNEYIPHFAHAILILQKSALRANPNHALAAIEQSLLVCYSAILPKNVHGTGKCNDVCIEWQRQTFFAVIDTVETAPEIDRAVSENVLKISEIMTGMSEALRDIHQRITAILACRHEELSWH
jgi:hypothetical protein